MANLVVQHSMQDTSLLAKDRYVNVLHVSTLGNVDEPFLVFLSATVRAFFNNQGANANSGVIDYLASHVTGAGSTCKIYDQSLPLHSPPLHTDTFQMQTLQGLPAALPGEVAVALTLEAGPVAGVPAARTRGRMYIGPLNVRAGSELGDPLLHSRPTAQFQQVLRDQFTLMQNTLTGHNPSAAIQVYSPTIARTNPGGAHHVVRAISTDDAFDTQRRRGVQPTTRSRSLLVVP